MGKKKKKAYEHDLEALQIELVGLTRWLRVTGKRMLVILEGRDAAGKGGTIKAITDKLDTRAARVVAMGKPSQREEGQWYFQRYVTELPSAGELVLFDRSWYNRAVVEPAMGFCTEEQYDAFMKACPAFEKLLTDDGILLYKYWLSVDQDLQEERFAERAADPLKRWKLSPVDLKARDKYVEMGDLRDAMIQRTDTEDAPWFIADFNDQKAGRLNLIRHLLDQVPDKLVPETEFDLPPLKGKPKKDKVTAKAAKVPKVY
ncbi:MAG: polyphosphate kinase 2 [Luteibacter sp.]